MGFVMLQVKTKKERFERCCAMIQIIERFVKQKERKIAQNAQVCYGLKTVD